MFFIRSCGLTPPGHQATGIGLGGLVPTTPSPVLGGLAPSAADFVDFRTHGPRLPPFGLTSSPGVWSIDTLPLTAPAPSLSPRERFRPRPRRAFPPAKWFLPPQSSARTVLALEPDSALPAASVTPPRRILDPTQVISTRTRRKQAAVAGSPLPPVDYGFYDDLSPPSPTRISAPSRPPRRPPRVPPASTVAASDAPSLPSPVPPDSSESSPSLASTTHANPPPASAAVPSHRLPQTPPESAPSPIEAALHSSAELEFRAAVARFSHADWAREQRNELVCDAAIRYILLDRPSVLPSDFWDDRVPLTRRPSLLEIRELANKGRLHIDDDGLALLVRKQTKAPSPPHHRPGGRAARLLNDESLRIYVPMLMRPGLCKHATRMRPATSVQLARLVCWNGIIGGLV